MKLPYVCALALHIEEARQMICENMYTGLRPKEVLSGTLNPLVLGNERLDICHTK